MYEVTAQKVEHQQAWRKRKCVWRDQLSLKLPSICLHYGNRVRVMALNLTLPLISREMATLLQNTHTCTHTSAHMLTGASTMKHGTHAAKWKHPAAAQVNHFLLEQNVYSLKTHLNTTEKSDYILLLSWMEKTGRLEDVKFWIIILISTFLNNNNNKVMYCSLFTEHCSLQLTVCMVPWQCNDSDMLSLLETK